MHQRFPDNPPPIPPAGGFPAGTAGSGGGVQEGERTYALFTHLTLLLILLPLVPVIPPLVMWLIKRDRS